MDKDKDIDKGGDSMDRGKESLLRTARKDIREHKLKAAVYFILRLSVIATMIAQFLNKNYNDVFLCVLTLILFLVPAFVNKRLNIELPNTLEIIILVFIYAAEILGEIREYYLLFDKWDSMLHTLNGFLCAALGFAMIDILNRTERFYFKMTPGFVALISFCYSMTIGVLWEFFEYFMDLFARTDMQKDTIISSISTVSLNPQGKNVPVIEQLNDVVINGIQWPGYLDIGLIDTMSDLLVNFVGAIVFSLFGYFYIKNRGKSKFVERFIPRRRSENRNSD